MEIVFLHRRGTFRKFTYNVKHPKSGEKLVKDSDNQFVNCRRYVCTAGFITICEEEIISNMCLENIAIVLTVIDQDNNVEKLKDSAIEFFTNNAKELSENESFSVALHSLSTSFMAEVMSTMMSKILIPLFNCTYISSLVHLVAFYLKLIFLNFKLIM